MKSIKVILTLCLFFLSFSSYSQSDPDPYRGLYVNYFGPRDGFWWTDIGNIQHWQQPNFTHILGNDTLEDHLLEYAKDNNFKRLDLFELWQMFNPNADSINLITGNLWSDDL